MSGGPQEGAAPVGGAMARDRAALLAAALPHAAFDGWPIAFEKAIADCAFDAGHAELVFPNGAADLVGYFWQSMDGALADRLAACLRDGMGISERVGIALREYIALLAPHREAVRRAMAFQALPHNAAGAARALYGTVDTIWRAVGDTSTDFNFYTKRLTLAAVVAATLTHWLAQQPTGDDAADAAAIGAFIDRRLVDVLRVEKLKAQARGLAARLPDPLRLLGQIGGLRGGFAGPGPGRGHPG